MSVGVACRCLDDIAYFMTPHTHEESEPDVCPRCGWVRLMYPYPEPYCPGCGRQFDWGQVVP